MSLVPDTQIGAYRVVRSIGEGGMGVVWLGEHVALGRRAAIKVLHPAFSAQRDIVDRFFNEARAAATVADPGIVQIFDFGFHGNGTAYIVMELLDGESLHARIRRLGALPPEQGVRIVRQAAGSLAAAHARGIVHRDLKPDNLFIVRDPEAPGGERTKILDFGIAKLTADGGTRDRTRTDALIGTPTYMSPEQCRGAGFVDHRSDIYSLGCVLFHLLTGRPPFDYEGLGDIIAAHLREAPPLPSLVVSAAPAALDELVTRMLAKSPELRFQSMGEVAHACGALAGHLARAGAEAWCAPAGTAVAAPATTLGAATGQVAPPRVARTGRGRWAALLAIVPVAGVLWWHYQRHDATPSGMRAAAPVASPRAVTTRDAAVDAVPRVVLSYDAAVEVATPPPNSRDATPADARRAVLRHQPAHATERPSPTATRQLTKESLYDDR